MSGSSQSHHHPLVDCFARSYRADFLLECTQLSRTWWRDLHPALLSAGIIEVDAATRATIYRLLVTFGLHFLVCGVSHGLGDEINIAT